jgi:alpha-beta hydrolase superfamily lysophospholipase
MRAEATTGMDRAAPRPVLVPAGERPIFAWHHSPPSDLRRGAAIVLCPPLGYEYMSVYRTWRRLAARLAAKGFDALRIEYDGTGNSSGDEEDPARVEAWLRSVSCGIAEARRLSGSSSVALIGLRVGAVLALQAAVMDRGVQRLVLWSPFGSGRAFVRELKAFARLSWQDQADEDVTAPGINAAGYMHSQETVDALAAWSIEAVRTQPSPDVLIVERDDRPPDPALAARLESLGSHVTTIWPEGTAEMLVPPQLATVPERVLDGIAAWFQEWDSATAPVVPVADSAAIAITTGDHYQERAVRFGRDDRLFGMLSTPRVDGSSAPAVILLNTGVEHHVGPHRLYVPLAREWAAHGHAVLRFDIGGIGESDPPDGGEDNFAYPQHMLDDAREAIAFVQQTAPQRRIVLAGLCSGGWLAFLAAREGLPIHGIVAVNAPLYLRDGSAGRQWLSEEHELELYRDALRARSMRVKELRGRASYGKAARALLHQLTLKAGGVLAGTSVSGLSRDLHALADRGIASLFVFSRGDDGLRYFQLHGGRALTDAPVSEFVRHVVIDGAGHSFRPRAAQHALRRLLSEFVETATLQEPY